MSNNDHTHGAEIEADDKTETGDNSHIEGGHVESNSIYSGSINNNAGSHNDRTDGVEINVDSKTETNGSSHVQDAHGEGNSIDSGSGNIIAGTPASNVTGNLSAHRYQEHEVDNDGYEHHYADAGGIAVANGQAATGGNTVAGSLTSRNAIEGSDSDDIIRGGNQTDVIDGGNGNDHVEGNDGDDVLIGGNSTDSGHNNFVGGAGNDIMVAAGRKTQDFDHLVRNNTELNQAIHADAKYASVADIVDNNGIFSIGQNTFEFLNGNSGDDLILNFHVNTDRLVIQRNINGSGIEDEASLLSHVSTYGNDVTVDLGGGNSVTLVGVDATALSHQNILFV